VAVGIKSCHHFTQIGSDDFRGESLELAAKLHAHFVPPEQLKHGADDMGAERVPVAGKLSQARDTLRGVMTVARREAAARHGAGPVRDRDSRDG